MKASALWHTDKANSEIKTEILDQVPGHILVESIYSLISIGTEKIIATGRVPLKAYDAMKVPYMRGSFALPLKYGYSLVGSISDGSLIHIMHPHQDILSVSPMDITPIPRALPAERASLLSNMETALNAFWDADLVEKDDILIIGYGLLGALTAGILNQYGFKKITILELNPFRKEKARTSGYDILENPLGRGWSAIFHTTATQSGLQFAIDHATQNGKIIEMSWYADSVINLSLGADFHYKRLKLFSSQVSSIPNHKNKQWTFASRKSEIIRLLMDPFWDSIVEDIIPFKQVPELFGAIRNQTINPLSFVIKY